MSSLDLEVLYEDNHLLVINKPAGLATMGVTPGERSAVTLVANYIKDKYQKPGNVFVGVVSRLDSMVSGVLVLARTSKAASRLSEQFRDRSTEKRYLAVVIGLIEAGGWQTVHHHVIKDERLHRMKIVPATHPGAQDARLRFRSLASTEGRTLLEVDLLTGRKHQIRLQLSALGMPILGDSKYDSTARFPAGIALHAGRLGLKHPTREERLVFTAPLPKSWHKLPQSILAAANRQCRDQE